MYPIIVFLEMYFALFKSEHFMDCIWLRMFIVTEKLLETKLWIHVADYHYNILNINYKSKSKDFNTIHVMNYVLLYLAQTDEWYEWEFTVYVSTKI